jgi:hypothetical protein
MMMLDLRLSAAQKLRDPGPGQVYEEMEQFCAKAQLATRDKMIVDFRSAIATTSE